VTRSTSIYIGYTCYNQKEKGLELWQDYDYSYYEKNKNKMLSPQKVAVKIVEMILDIKNYKNGVSIEMYTPEY
jgi:hypothetical protein